MGRPGCSLCHPSLCFSHSVDGHLSTLPRERQWFLLAWVNTQESNISHVSAEKRPVSGDFAYSSDVLVHIKSDSTASVMERELHRVWLTRSPELTWSIGCCLNPLVDDVSSKYKYCTRDFLGYSPISYCLLISTPSVPTSESLETPCWSKCAFYVWSCLETAHFG